MQNRMGRRLGGAAVVLALAVPTAALAHAVALAEESPTTRIDVLNVHAPDEFVVGSMTPLAPEAREQVERAMASAMDEARAVLGDRVSLRTVSGG